MTDEERIEKAIEEGRIDLYADDSAYLRNTIDKLNAEAKEGRAAREKFRRFEALFVGVNLTLFIIISILVIVFDTLDGHMISVSILAKIFIIGIIWIGVAIVAIGSNSLTYGYEITTAISLMFLVISPLYFIITAFSAIYCMQYHKKLAVYQSLPGYPNFQSIFVNYLKLKKEDKITK